MNQIIKRQARQVIIALRQFLRKPLRIGLAVLLSLAVVINASTREDFVQAQGSQVQTQASPLQLHHITLSVNDVERVSQWYADVLGFTISDRFTLTRADGRQIQVVRIEMPGLQMNISKFDSSVPPEHNKERQGWRHLAFQVDSVDQNYQRLRARGVQFLGEPFTYDPPGYRVAFLRDLEGNILELYQDL